MSKSEFGTGTVTRWQPAFPMIIDQPYYDAAEGNFDSASGPGDIGFDLAYGRTTDSGLVWAVGVVSTLPTATKDELGSDRWNLGPEFPVGKLTKKYVPAALTTYLPGGGWNVATAPIMSYDHENSHWTLPINFTLSKTVIWNGRPWKLSAEVS